MNVRIDYRHIEYWQQALKRRTDSLAGAGRSQGKLHTSKPQGCDSQDPLHEGAPADTRQSVPQR